MFETRFSTKIKAKICQIANIETKMC